MSPGEEIRTLTRTYKSWSKCVTPIKSLNSSPALFHMNIWFPESVIRVSIWPDEQVYSHQLCVTIYRSSIGKCSNIEVRIRKTFILAHKPQDDLRYLPKERLSIVISEISLWVTNQMAWMRKSLLCRNLSKRRYTQKSHTELRARWNILTFSDYFQSPVLSIRRRIWKAYRGQFACCKTNRKLVHTGPHLWPSSLDIVDELSGPRRGSRWAGNS